MTGALAWAVRSRPLEPAAGSGDLHVVAPFPEGALLAVIDGLGHGAEAALAAQRAAEILSGAASADPVELLQSCHAGLRGTRGAAMLVLSLSYRDALVSWVGVGNVEGWRLTSGGREAVISQAGVVGYQITRPRLRSAPLAPGDAFILASDGIAPRFGDILRDAARPEELAQQIFENYALPTDDALVLVARYVGEGVA